MRHRVDRWAHEARAKDNHVLDDAFVFVLLMLVCMAIVLRDVLELVRRARESR